MNLTIYLVFHPEAKTGYNAPKLRSSILSLPGTLSCCEGDETIHSETILFQCELQRNEKDLSIRVQKSQPSAVIEGDSELALHVAIELQRNYGEEIYAISEASAPEVFGLSTVTAPSDLAAKLRVS